MSKILVVHSYYGCDTGCCGHVIQIDGSEIRKSFDFTHPPYPQTEKLWLEWAQDFVREQCGEEHVVDLDWENCSLIDD